MPIALSQLVARCLSGVVLAFALGANPLHAKDAPEAIAVDGSFKAAEQAGKLLRAAEGRVLKDIKKIAVPLFSVEFVIADSERAETSGFASAGRASTSVSYKLKGVEEADFQAITATLYEQFLTDIRAAGIEVVSLDKVSTAPTYKKLIASGVPSPIRSSSALTFAPPGMSIYGFSKTQTGGTSSGASFFGALSQMGAGFGGVSAAMDTVTLQQELEATVVEIQMKVNFVQLTNLNKGFLGRLSNTATVEGKVSPSVATATFSVQSSATRGSLTLTNPLALDSAAFSDVRKKPATTGDIVGGVAAILLRAAAGNKDSSSSEDLEAIADPAKYRQIVGNGLATVNQMFLQRLKVGE